MIRKICSSKNPHYLMVIRCIIKPLGSLATYNAPLLLAPRTKINFRKLQTSSTEPKVVVLKIKR